MLRAGEALTDFVSDGSEWWIDEQLVCPGDFVIDGGVGVNVFAMEHLIFCRGAFVVGVDPDFESLRYIASRKVAGYLFVLGALTSSLGDVDVFINRKGSDSCFPDHRGASTSTYRAAGVSLESLVRELKPSLVKLDVEGMEYEVYEQCFGVRQVLIEFHHRMIERFTEEDTLAVVRSFEKQGYQVAHRTKHDEYTFILP